MITLYRIPQTGLDFFDCQFSLEAKSWRPSIGVKQSLVVAPWRCDVGDSQD